MTYFCQSRWVLASTSSFVLFLILSAATTNVDAQQKPSLQKRKGEPATASEESPIEKLGRMIVGTWAINASIKAKTLNDSSDPFSVPFVITNDGTLPLYDLDYAIHVKRLVDVAIDQA
jgi:hypothetical protein